MSDKVTSYVCEITEEEAEKLLGILKLKGWLIKEAPYSRFKASKDKTSVVAYNSGKLTVQGKGTSDFVLYILEPDILRVASFGYEDVIGGEQDRGFAEVAEYEDHGGVDESGKGDFFGPLVIASAFVSKKDQEVLIELGVKDSKIIKSEKKIVSIASKIRKTISRKFSIVAIGPEAYNRNYNKIGNLNKLLAWGHARAIENLIELVPDCDNVLSDKFGNESLIKNALMGKSKKIKLRQQTKAESDTAVAAASILARDEFVRRINSLSEEYGITFYKGASDKVVEAGRMFVEKYGLEKLCKVAKMHFKTALKIVN